MFAYYSLWFINASVQEKIISLDAATCSMNPNCTPEMVQEKIRISNSAGESLGSDSRLAALGAGLAFLRTGKKEV